MLKLHFEHQTFSNNEYSPHRDPLKDDVWALAKIQWEANILSLFVRCTETHIMHDSQPVYCCGSISNPQKKSHTWSRSASLRVEHVAKVRGNTSSFQSSVAGSKWGLWAMIFERILMSLDSLALEHRAVVWYTNFILHNKLDYGGGGTKQRLITGHRGLGFNQNMLLFFVANVDNMRTLLESDILRVLEGRLN